MQQAYPALADRPSWVVVMPTPGPLGRLVRRRRAELGLTQPELSDLTAQCGERVPQNMISRIESGKSQRINDVARLASLGNALGLESDVEFVMAAYAPGKPMAERGGYDAEMEILPPGPEGEIIALVRRRPDDQKRRALEVLKILFAEDPS